MENKFKRFLSLLLALVMVIGMMPMGHVHAAESDSDALVAAYAPVTDLSDIDDVGESAKYVIAAGRTDSGYGIKTMIGNAVSDDSKSGLELITTLPADVDSENYPSAFWTITKVEDGYTISVDGTNNIKVNSNNSTTLEADAVVQIRVSETSGYGTGYFEIHNGNNVFLNYFNSFGSLTTSGCAASAWTNADAGAQWMLYKAVTAEELEAEIAAADPWGKRNWTGTADTETSYDSVEGLFSYAWDRNSTTRWHSNWQGATDQLDEEGETFTGEINFGQEYTIDQFSFTPRTDQDSGQVTQASLYVKDADDTEWKLVAEHVTFADSYDKKSMCFEEQAVQYVKFVAEASDDGWVAVSEFDIDNTDHTFSRTTTPATCTTDGSTVCSCSCGYGYTTVITATGHTDEDGNNECDTCGEPLCSHENTTSYEAKDATCTEAGHTASEYCNDCETWLTVEEEIPATGHQNTELQDYVAATLTSEGYTGNTYCNDCQTIIEYGEVSAMLIEKNAKVLSDNRILDLSDCEYTLTSTGDNTWSLCHEGAYYVKPCASGSTIPQTESEFTQLTLTQSGEALYIASTLASNVAGGGSIHIWTAGKDVPYWDRCGSAHTYNASNGTHELYFFIANEDGSGDEIPGYTKVAFADIQAGESYLIAALQGDSTWYIMNPSSSTEKFDHIALLVTDAVTHEHSYETVTVDATCTTDGSVTETCTCGHKHVTVIPATGHLDTEVQNAKAATLTEEGYTGDTYCNDCQQTIATGETIPVLTMKNAKVLSDSSIIALSECEYVLGGTDGAYSLCHGGNYYVNIRSTSVNVNQTTTASAYLNLDWDDYTDGRVSIWQNTDRPGYLYFHYSDTTPKWNANGSLSGDNTGVYLLYADDNSTNADIPGYTVADAAYVAAHIADGESYLIAAKNSAGNWYVMVPTVTSGTGTAIAQVVSDETTHTHEYETVTVAATCVAAGSVTETCTCGHKHVTVLLIDENAHSYESVVTDATCGAAGYTTYTCSGCGDVYTEEGDPATGNHSYGEWYTVTASTCIAAGTERRDCANCEAFETNGLALAEHTWTDATVDAPKTCSVCGATEGEKLTAVAQVGETKYATLAEAIEAVESVSDSITLLADITLTDVITIEKTIAILGNSKTITANVADAFTVVKGGYLSLTDVNVVSNSAPLYANGGVIDICNGTTVTSTSEVYALATVDNGGEMKIIPGAVVTSKYQNVVAVNNGTLSVQGTVTTNTDKEAWPAIYSWNCDGNGIYVFDGATVNGGISVAAGGYTQITDGTVNGGLYYTGAGSAENASMEVSGGTFDAAVPAEFCAEGYIPEDNGDGTYGVEPGTIINWYDEDGTTVLATTYVAEGEEAVYSGETPTKAEDANYTYTFSGWTECDGGYKATYTAAEKVASDKVVVSYIEGAYEAEVALRFYVEIPEAMQATAKVVLTKAGRWGNVVKEYTYAELKENNNGEKYADIGVASGEMMRTVTIQVFDGGTAVELYKSNGDSRGTSASSSIAEYVELVLGSNLDAKWKKAAAALLTYGGYAQQYFNVDASNPAYSVLPTEGDYVKGNVDNFDMDLTSYTITQSGTATGIKAKSIEAFLDSSIYLRVSFTLEEDVENYSVEVTCPDGTTQTPEFVYNSANGRYYVDIVDIVAAYLNDEYTITITKGNETYEVTTSVFAWAKLAINNSSNTAQVNMAKALCLYNQAVEAAFSEE